jgi:hypothetical protein
VLSTEAMATGNAGLTSYLLEHFFDPAALPPVLNTNKDNLYSNLEMVISNLHFRYELAKKGREYVEKYNNLGSITQNIINQLALEPSKRIYDIYPKSNGSISVPKGI